MSSTRRCVHFRLCGAFDDYDSLLTNRLDKSKDRLKEEREVTKALCEPVLQPIDYLRLLWRCGQQRPKVGKKVADWGIKKMHTKWGICTHHVPMKIDMMERYR